MARARPRLARALRPAIALLLLSRRRDEAEAPAPTPSIDYVITLPDGMVMRRTASGYTRTSPGGVVFTDRPLSQ